MDAPYIWFIAGVAGTDWMRIDIGKIGKITGIISTGGH